MRLVIKKLDPEENLQGLLFQLDIPARNQIIDGAGNRYDKKKAGHYSAKDKEKPAPIGKAQLKFSSAGHLDAFAQAFDNIARRPHPLQGPREMRFKGGQFGIFF